MAATLSRPVLPLYSNTTSLPLPPSRPSPPSLTPLPPDASRPCPPLAMPQVAANVALRDYPETVRQILIVDCDVHQGNGNAVLFSEKPSVFTFSMHCKANYFSERQVRGTRAVTSMPLSLLLSSSLPSLSVCCRFEFSPIGIV